MTAWLPVVGPIIEKVLSFIPDPEQRARAELAAKQADYDAEVRQLELALQADKMQTDINLAEAQHPNLFVSGWRSFIGWVCGVAFAYHFILQPFLAFVLTNQGHPVTLPAFDMDALNTVLLGMLGLSASRSFEKVRGVTK